MKSTESRLCIGWMVLCWKGIVIGWKRLESTKLGLVHTSVMDSEAAGVSQIGTRCPTVWPQIAFQNRSHDVFLCWVSIPMILMKTSACERWFSALNGEKTNLLQEFFSPSNWLSLQSSEPASNSMIHLHILSAFWTQGSIFQRKYGDEEENVDKGKIKQPLLKH